MDSELYTKLCFVVIFCQISKIWKVHLGKELAEEELAVRGDGVPGGRDQVGGEVGDLGRQSWEKVNKLPPKLCKKILRLLKKKTVGLKFPNSGVNENAKT